MFLKVLKDVLSREYQQEVLYWPWGVLKLAILTGDLELIQMADTVVQHLISEFYICVHTVHNNNLTSV